MTTKYRSITILSLLFLIAVLIAGCGSGATGGIDRIPPSNPTVTTGYSTTGKTSEIVSDGWYNYGSPYFEWSGASDSGSGIAGYYVYFGTDPKVDPEASGAFQTSENYTVSAGLTSGSTYYLLIKAKDNAGNIAADTHTAFVYKHEKTAPSNTTPANFINNGASDTLLPEVTLSISGTDNVGISGYYISEDPTTPDVTASGWTTITSTKNFSISVSFTLSSEAGIKTVYVWFKDAAGNISLSANDSIIYLPSDVIAIAGGNRHTVSLNKDGTVWAWGYNLNGQLGDVTMTDSLLPVQVNGL